MRRFSNKKSVGELVKYYLDSPVDLTPIEQSSFLFRGWVVLSGDVDLESLNFWLAGSNNRRKISRQERPDVARERPKLTSTGFFAMIDYSDVFPSDTPLSLEIEHPGGSFTIDTGLVATDGAGMAEGYFRQARDESRKVLTLSADQFESWDQNGFLQIPGFYDTAELDAMNAHIDGLWIDRRSLTAPIVIDTCIGTDRENRELFCNTQSKNRDQPYKLNDLYLADEVVRKMLLNPRLSRILQDLLNGAPTICSSLYFERGSQQRTHCDTFYMAPLIKDRMVATWIALEDIAEDAGPLVYYPGSHLIEAYRFKDGRYNLTEEERPDCFEYIDAEFDRRGIKSETIQAKGGDLFIWHAQLFHGGAAITDPHKTRRTLVTHYFRHGDPMGTSPEEEFAPGCYKLNRDYLQP